jgi:hypothetical protein
MVEPQWRHACTGGTCRKGIARHNYGGTGVIEAAEDLSRTGLWLETWGQPSYLFCYPGDPFAHLHLSVGHLKGGPRRAGVYPLIEFTICFDANRDALPAIGAPQQQPLIVAK